MVVLIILLVSVGVGLLLRRFPAVNKISESSGLTVFLLLFVFGITIGLDKKLMAGFSSLGLQAVAMAVAGVVGSIVFSLLIMRIFKRSER